MDFVAVRYINRLIRGFVIIPNDQQVMIADLALSAILQPKIENFFVK